ncbi:MAG TPA: DUF6531 domain-containing protein, partial [Bacillota bacterium]|nr:DUF6531 domain-containing protein [Bacillota bacterium]
MRNKLKFLLPVLWLTLLTLVSPFFVTADTTGTIAPDPQYPPGEEIIEARSTYSKIFRNGPTKSIYISTTPLHYFNTTNHKWENIDTSLEEEAGLRDGEEFGFKSLRNTMQCFLPKYGDGWTQIQSGEYRLNFQMVNGNRRLFRKKDKTSLRYDDVFPGCSVSQSIKPGGVKEDIVISARAAAPHEFEYRIRARNLEASKTGDGEILFKEPQGNLVFSIPKPFMYDATGAISEEIQTELVKQGDEYRLALTPSQNWLNAPERTYPIVIDPTVIDIHLNGESHDNGESAYYYMPSIQFVTNEGTSIPVTDPKADNKGSELFNRPSIFPYKVKVSYKASSQGGAYYWSAIKGKFSINYWNPNNDILGDVILSKSFPNSGGVFSGEFELPSGSAARFKLTNPTFYRALGIDPWSGNCTLTINCQKESMSPESNWVDPLPPTSPGGMVTLRWTEAVDEWNEGAWSQPTYATTLFADFLKKASGIAGYRVQYSTTPSFTDPVFYPATTLSPLSSATLQCSISGLTIGQQYFFRVVAYDLEGNPRNYNPWTSFAPFDGKLDNPSGPRWSNIVTTTCVNSLPAGVPAQPSITDISPKNTLSINEEPSRDYCDSKTPTITWNQVQPSAQVCMMKEDDFTKSYITANNTSKTQINPLSDGNYVAYVQTQNSAGLSPWSEGRRVTIDTTPPTISGITESADGSSIILKFTSSEPVRVDKYWDYALVSQDSGYPKYNWPTDLKSPLVTLTGVYQDPSKPHYYRLVFWDGAKNCYDTGTIQYGSGPGNNVVNTDHNFGQESYYNLQAVSLGRAGTANVNLNNGNLTITATDFSIPGRGLPLAMSRFYNSLTDSQGGMLGKGWRTSFEMSLTVVGQNVTINDPDGSTHAITYSNGSFTHQPGDFRRVSWNSFDNTYTVTDPSGIKYAFGAPQNNSCRLNSITDRFGNCLSFNYRASDGKLLSIAEPSGRITAIFEHNYLDPYSGRYLLSKISFTPLEPGTTYSRYITFSYWKGRLSQVRYPTQKSIGPVLVENVINYGYDSVTELLNSSGVCQMCGSDLQSGSRKNDTQFEYKAARRSVGVISTGFSGTPVRYFFNYDGTTTTVTDPRGSKFVYAHYDSGQCRSVTYPVCKKADGSPAASPAPIYYTYDGDFHLKTVTQSKEVYNPATDTETPTDIVTSYTYDFITGNLETVIADTYGKQLTTVITYESEHNGVLTDIASVKDAKLQTTTYQNIYDGAGKLTKLTIIPPPNPDSYTITHTFNQYGERVAKDVTAGALNYHFDYGYQNGLLTTLSNYFGTTSDEYSLYGELKSTTDANKVKTNYQILANTGQLKAVYSPQEYPVN